MIKEIPQSYASLFLNGPQIGGFKGCFNFVLRPAVKRGVFTPEGAFELLFVLTLRGALSKFRIVITDAEKFPSAFYQKQPSAKFRNVFKRSPWRKPTLDSNSKYKLRELLCLLIRNIIVPFLTGKHNTSRFNIIQEIQ